MKKLLLLVFVILFLGYKCHSQSKIQVNNVKGECVISHITPEQAREKAIESAKLEALRKSGISEEVVSFDILRTSSNNDIIRQSYNSLIYTNICGKVIDWKISSERKFVDEFGNLLYEVVLDTKVIKYMNELDPLFKLSVKGIKAFYENGSNLEFSLKSSMDGFLKIFLIGKNNDISILFPNCYEAIEKIVGETEYQFPISELIDYKLNTKGVEEDDIILFVLLKENSIPDSENEKKLLEWLYSIKKDAVYYEFVSFKILNNSAL